ncbi:winged helix-turn-helix transcriptional regulator [Nocardioides anomalus]|uniref:Winged helix-turn-helix transcriptional regulator n=1 Tax=Nocardioides anomalus TaxID=2712223 RepID=A0A6G6WJ69_9ACTN|nr:MarR family winged helix-turn-helix transcriptional regulator [Nocardioides anomalus]QIG45378.1 winged helix-turn-helix transcriptional regulator [Nocardioides anomalus]
MPRPTGVALLLSQVGAHTSARFAQRVAELGLTPEHVAVLRVVGQHAGLNQQALAARLGAAPSRVVRLVDELEEEGLLERRQSPHDRRHRELHTVGTAEGRLMSILSAVGEHEREITRALDPDEKRTLFHLLDKIAADQGLDGDGHPGSGR